MDISAEIDSLSALPLPELQKRWRARYRRDPPKGLPPKLIREAFVYGLQEHAFGGLSAKTKRRLSVLAAKVEEDPKAPVCGDGALRPGTRLVREWRGKRYEVEVLENGFGLDGKVYNSLTEVARTLTGTNWSGPRFFGLKKRSRR
ncbi:MAG: DUF2924 domain-containing protein [Pseudomonadota bacterium]